MTDFEKNPMKILSLGAGIQSSALLLMSCRGVLPLLDAAIFADTQWEPRAVYENLQWLEVEAKKVGIPIYRVTAGNLRQNAITATVRGKIGDGEVAASMPLFTFNPDGGHGQIRRQCTSTYKIDPINLFIKRELFGLEPYGRMEVDAVELWKGISSDELRRVKMSREYWQKAVYPLVGLPYKYLDHAYSRNDCQKWLADNYPDREFVRSACIGCPFHNNNEWRRIKSNPEEWADAVEVDRKIRNSGKLRGQLFLHAQRVPLEEAELNEDQMDLGLHNECLGYCGS